MTPTAATAQSAENAPATGARAALGPALQLNSFQRLMRKWNSLAPYNAAQVMQISGEGDLARWQQAAEGIISELGLGRPVFNDTDTAVEFQPMDFIAVDRVSGELETQINEGLNRAFGDDELPIRFFMLPRADGSHYFGAVYDHWIADSRGMRELMQRIFARYQGGGNELPRLTLQAPPFMELYRKNMGLWPYLTAVRELLRNFWRHRRAYRINLPDPMNFRTRVLYRPLPEGLIERTHAYAKAHNASVNDAFLAILGQALGQFTAPDRYKPRAKRMHLQRNEVGLGTIVDIRDVATQSLEQVFGLYLSNYTIVLAKPEQRPVEELLAYISRRTRRIKKGLVMVRAFTALAVARMSWSLCETERQQAMMIHKTVPTVAGISNVNMTGSWVDAPAPANGEPVVLDYLRISPAGPLLPLVFTLTTIGKRLSLCMTYRMTAFTDEQAAGIMQDFVSRLQSLPGA